MRSRLRRRSSLFVVGAALLTVCSSAAAVADDPVAPKPAAAVTLTSDAELSIVPPGNTVRVRIQSTTTFPAQGKTIWRATDLDGKQIASGELAPSDSALSFTAPTAFHGIVYVTLETRDAAGTVVASGDTRLAVMDTKQDRPPTSVPCLYAANAHLGGRALTESRREIAVMKAAGFGACRFGCTWQHVQPTEGVWKWEEYDSTFADLKAANIIPLPLVAYTAQWASTGDPKSKNWHDWNNAPPHVELYTAYLSAAIARYKSYTRYWEIWNEPDIDFWLGTPEQYAELLSASVVAAHKADPKALVMNGGFSETKRRPNFIPQMLARLTTPPDIYAYHSHGGLPNLERATTTNRAYMADAKLAQLPMWDNESGYSNLHGGTEREQASQLLKKMTYAPAQEVAAYALYDLRNDGEDPNENEHNFGIVRRDFAPKASFVAVHNFLSQINGKAFQRAVPLGPLGRGYLFADKKTALLVFWADLPVGGERDVLLRLGSENSPRLMDMMGNESAVTTRSERARLPLRRDPQFLVLSPAAAARLAALPPALETPETISVAPGEPVHIPVTLRNPFSKPLSATLTTEAGAGPTTVPVTLAPDATVTKDILLSPKFAPTAGRQTARIILRAPELPQEISVSTEVRPALIAPLLADPAADTSTRRPSATLHVHPNGVALFRDTPIREMQLRDDEDLSATVWVGHTAHAIVLDVRAHDDIHTQNELPTQMWKGDSLQLALLTPRNTYYEWTVGLTKDGPLAHVEAAPKEAAATGITTVIRREGNDTVYRVTIPDTLPGIAEMLATGGKLNLLVNDNDGQGRKGWVEWAPGIGMTKDTHPFVSAVFR